MTTVNFMSTLIDPWGKKQMQSLLCPVIPECPFAEIGCDRDGGDGTPKTTCRHNDNIPEGSAWGKCSLDACPCIPAPNVNSAEGRHDIS